MMGTVNLSRPLELISHPVDGRILEVLTGADAVSADDRARAPRRARQLVDAARQRA
jgi:hypothetical protein